MAEKINKPECIGIIMDGNRRFAKKNGRNAIDGHNEGYNKLKDVLKWVNESGIKNLIVYAFSTENWNRSQGEVDALIKLLGFVLSNKIDELSKGDVKLKFVGDLSRFSESFREMMKKAEEKTAGNNSLALYIALSYGGRAEILNAVKQISKLPHEKIEGMDEISFKEYLWTKDMPDPDLVIRTGGEMRLSNFLPYQIVYSELFFTKTLWPDFSREEFDAILIEFAERKINHGK